MAKSVHKSYKIIAVYSQNFFKSRYCPHKLHLAKHRLLNRRDSSHETGRRDRESSTLTIRPSRLPGEDIEQRHSGGLEKRVALVESSSHNYGLKTVMTREIPLTMFLKVGADIRQHLILTWCDVVIVCSIPISVDCPNYT